jgi:hypothetical protein
MRMAPSFKHTKSSALRPFGLCRDRSTLNFILTHSFGVIAYRSFRTCRVDTYKLLLRPVPVRPDGDCIFNLLYNTSKGTRHKRAHLLISAKHQSSMAADILKLINEKMVLPRYTDKKKKVVDMAKQQFITEHDMKEIWTKAHLRQFFSDHDINLPEDDLDTIQTESIRVLSTLILVGCDGTKAWTETLKALFTPRHHLKDSQLPLEGGCVIEGLTDQKLQNFVIRQFETVPVTFDEANGSTEISTLFRLPIVSSEDVTGGAYGQVFKIEIPKGYHRRADGYTNFVSMTAMYCVINQQN